MSEELKACPECGGKGYAEIIDGYERPCDACQGEETRAPDPRIAALIAAGDKLARFAAHDSECALGLHGQACSCGYTPAQKAWREARDAQ